MTTAEAMDKKVTERLLAFRSVVQHRGLPLCCGDRVDFAVTDDLHAVGWVEGSGCRGEPKQGARFVTFQDINNKPARYWYTTEPSRFTPKRQTPKRQTACVAC